MAVQARKDTILKKVTQGDELKPGNVWVVTWEKEIIQIPKDEFRQNPDKFKSGPYFSWGLAHSYLKEQIITFKELVNNAITK